jgi:hypothetical protein
MSNAPVVAWLQGVVAAHRIPVRGARNRREQAILIRSARCGIHHWHSHEERTMSCESARVDTNETGGSSSPPTSPSRTWAIESACGETVLAQQLVAARETVLDVPPTLSAGPAARQHLHRQDGRARRTGRGHRRATSHPTAPGRSGGSRRGTRPQSVNATPGGPDPTQLRVWRPDVRTRRVST